MSVLAGRGILITGGSIGIGNSVAHACVGAGAEVAICARNRGELEKAQAELEAVAGQARRVLAKPIDVSSPDEVTALVGWLEREAFPLTGVVNAAGVLGPTGALDEVDANEWISTVQVNLIGTMLVCRAVLPIFRKRRYGKIVNFSGGGATSPRPRFSAYAASKTAVVRLTENLAKEEESSGIFANAVAPGAVNTRMLKQVLDAGAEQVGQTAYQDALKQKQSGGAPAEKAAALCVALLSPSTDGITGKLISAVWDPWESLATHKDELNGSDVYTLRRITPNDRGLRWQ
jgi:NAD(P)-dependent dehydrogenase (short-subunit alcohol dehydrogenase family)